MLVLNLKQEKDLFVIPGGPVRDGRNLARGLFAKTASSSSCSFWGHGMAPVTPSSPCPHWPPAASRRQGGPHTSRPAPLSPRSPASSLRVPSPHALATELAVDAASPSLRAAPTNRRAREAPPRRAAPPRGRNRAGLLLIDAAKFVFPAAGRRTPRTVAAAPDIPRPPPATPCPPLHPGQRNRGGRT